MFYGAESELQPSEILMRLNNAVHWAKSETIAEIVLLSLSPKVDLDLELEKLDIFAEFEP